MPINKPEPLTAARYIPAHGQAIVVYQDQEVVELTSVEIAHAKNDFRNIESGQKSADPVRKTPIFATGQK